MSIYTDHVRPVLRRHLFSLVPGPNHATRHVAVAGLPRSGTSWLAKILALSSGVFYYFEPDQCLGSDLRYKYVPRGQSDSEIRTNISSSLRGELYSDYITAELGLKHILGKRRAETVLLKWVWLSFALDYVADEFPQMKVVQIVRHPIPQFLSWRERDWDPAYSLKLVTRQPALMDGPLRGYADRILAAAAGSYWEGAVAFWAAAVLMQQRAQTSNESRGWVLRTHEWFCEFPEQRMRWLIEHLGMAWNDDIARFLDPGIERASGPGYGKARNPRQEIDKWKGVVPLDEQREVEALIRGYGIDLYSGTDHAP